MILTGQEIKQISTVEHDGKVVVLGTDAQGVIWYSIKRSGFEVVLDTAKVGNPFGFENWQQLPLGRALSVDNSVIAHEQETLIDKQGNKILRSVYGNTDAVLKTVAAAVQVVSALGHIYVFRQNALGKILVNRFLMDGLQNKLVAKYEVRFRESAQRFDPDVAGTAIENPLDYRDTSNNFFFEPATELSFMAPVTKGWFCVVLLPTQNTNQHRWHIFAYDGTLEKIVSYSVRASKTGLFDVKDFLFATKSERAEKTYTLLPGIIQRTLELNGLEIVNGPSATRYDLQFEKKIKTGLQLVRGNSKLMLVFPVLERDGKINKTAAISFSIAKDGTLSRVDLTPDQIELLHSKGRDVILPLNTLEQIQAMADISPVPGGTITGIERGTKDQVRIQSRQSVSRLLKSGHKVKISGTKHYEGNYKVLAISDDSFEVAAPFINSEVGFWEQIEEKETGMVFDNRIVGYDKTSMDRLRVHCSGHDLNVGDEVQISGSEKQDGIYAIKEIDSGGAYFVLDSPYVTGEAINLRTVHRSGMRFDGYGDYLETPPLDLDDPQYNISFARTVSAWIKIDNQGNREQQVIDNHGEMLKLFVRADNQVEFRVAFSDHSIHAIEDPDPLPVNEWVHYAGAFNYDIDRGGETGMILTRNGIALSPVASGSTELLRGSEKVIIRDTPTHLGGQLFDFNGSGYLQLPDLNPDFPQGLTLEGWFYFDVIQAARFIDLSNGAFDNNILFYSYPGNNFRFQILSGNVGPSLDVSALETGQWIHLACTIDNNNQAIIYKNAQEVGTAALSLPQSLNRTLNYIGKSTVATEPVFKGKIAEVRLWNTARSQEDLQSDLFRRLQGNEQNLVNYWPLNGQTEDLSLAKQHATLMGGLESTQATYRYPVLKAPAFLQLDGATSYIEVPDNAKYRAALTLSCWIKSDTPDWNGTDCLISKQNSVILSSQKGQRRIQFRIFTTAWQTLEVADDVMPNIMAWHHYACTYDGDYMRLYIDGKEVNKKQVNGSIIFNLNPFFIGHDEFSKAYFSGAISEVRLYERAKSLMEINSDMYRPLTEDELDLVGYWPLRENAQDLSVLQKHGVIYGDTVSLKSSYLIGGDQADASNFIGEIAEVQIWGRALPEQEIHDAMVLRLTGKEPGLAAYYRMGAIVHDGDPLVPDFSTHEKHAIVHGDPYVGARSLYRATRSGKRVVKYANEALFAVSQSNSYEESFEFLLRFDDPTDISRVGLPLDPPVNPPISSGLLLHLAGETLETDQWQDLSGNNNHALVSGDMPVNYPVANHNNKQFDAVRFIPGQGLQLPDTLNLQAPFTIFLVDRYYGTTKGRTLQSRDNNWLLGKYSGNNGCFMGQWVGAAIPATTGAFDLNVASLEAGNAYWYLNGEQQGTATGAVAPGKLGLGKGLLLLEYSQADVACLLIYNRILSEQERQQTEWWLSQRYGVIGNFIAPVQNTPALPDFDVNNADGNGTPLFRFAYRGKTDQRDKEWKNFPANHYTQSDFTDLGEGWYRARCRVTIPEGVSLMSTFEINQVKGIWADEVSPPAEEWRAIDIRKHRICNISDKISRETYTDRIELSLLTDSNGASEDRLVDIRRAENDIDRIILDLRDQSAEITAALTQQATQEVLDPLQTQLKNTRATLPTAWLEFNEHNTAFLQELAAPGTLSMPLLKKDLRQLVTSGALLDFVRPHGTVNARASSQGYVTLSYIDYQNRLRQTPYDAVADSRNSSFEQWLPEAARACVECRESQDKVILDEAIPLNADAWSLEAWIYFPSAVQANGEPFAYNRLATAGKADDSPIVIKQGIHLGALISGTFHNSGLDLTAELSPGWHHLAAVSQSATTCFFLDGKEKGSISVMCQSDIKVLGNTPQGGSPAGRFAEVRLWDLALSDDEVAVNAHTLLSAYEPGLVAYWPCNEAEGAQARNRATDSLHGTLSGADWVACTALIGFIKPTGMPFAEVLQFTGKDATGVAPNIVDCRASEDKITLDAALPLQADAWSFEAWTYFPGPVQADDSPFPYHRLATAEQTDDSPLVIARGKRLGTLVNGFFFDTGLDLQAILTSGWYHVAAVARQEGTTFFINSTKVGKTSQPRHAIQFNGSNTYVEVPAFTNPTTSITVELWAKSDTATWNQHGCLVSKRDAFIMCPILGERRILFYIYSAGWQLIEFTPLDIQEWHHYAGTYDGNSLRLYIDGELVVEQAQAGSIAADNGIMTIGWDDGIAGRYFKGQISRVTLWKSARSLAQIQDDMYAPFTGQEADLIGYWSMEIIEQKGVSVVKNATGSRHGLIVSPVQSLSLPAQCRSDIKVLGNTPQGGAPAGWFAEVSLWSQALSDANIAAHANTLLIGDEANLMTYWPLHETGGIMAQNQVADLNHGTLSGAQWVACSEIIGSITPTGMPFAEILRFKDPGNTELPCYMACRENQNKILLNEALPLQADAWAFEAWMYFPGALLPASDPFAFNRLASAELADDSPIVIRQGKRLGTLVNGFFFDTGLDLQAILSPGWYHFAAVARQGGTTFFIDKEEKGETSQPRHAIQFNGSNTYVEVPAFTNPTTSITVELWAKSDTATWNQHGCLVSKRDAFIMHPMQGERRILFYIFSAEWKSIAFTPPDIQEWHHYAGTYDGSVLRLYIDGELVAQQAQAGSIAADNGIMAFGWDEGQAGQYFKGQISRVTLWESVRNIEQIQDDMYAPFTGQETELIGHWDMAVIEQNGSLIVEDATTRHPAQITGPIPILPQNQDIQALAATASHTLQFNGSNTYVEVPAFINPTAAITVELWAKSDTATWNQSGCLVSKRNAFIMCPILGERRILFYIYSAGWQLIEFTPLDIQEWHHYAGTYDGNSLRLYIDGELVVEQAQAGSIAADNGIMTIGWDDGIAGRYFKGQISRVALWETARSIDQIKTDMSSDFAGTEVGLVGYWSMEIIEQNGVPVVKDATGSRHGLIKGPVSLSLLPQSQSDIKVLGNTPQGGAPAGWFAEVRLWNQTRTNQEIEDNANTLLTGNEIGLAAYWHFNEAAGVEARNTVAGSPHGILLSGADWVCQTASFDTMAGSLFAQVLGFNTSGDHIEVPYHSDYSADRLTVSLWARVTDNVGSYRTAISFQNAPFKGFTLYAGDDNRWHFRIGTGIEWKNIAGPPVELNTWVHLTGTYDGTSMSFYINGNLTGTPLSIPFIPAENTFLLIGAGVQGNQKNYFLGQITEVRLFNTARTRLEIKRDMDHRLLGNEVNVSGYWPLTALQPSEADPLLSQTPDLSPNTCHGTVYGGVLPVENSDLPSAKADHLVTAEYSVTETNAQGKKESILRQFLGFTTESGVTLLPEKRIEALVRQWIEKTQIKPNLIGYIEGPPPVPSENLTIQQSYDGATSIHLVESETNEYTWERSRDIGKNMPTTFSIGPGFEGTVGLGFELSAQIFQTVDTTFNSRTHDTKGSEVSASLTTTKRTSVDLRGKDESTAQFPRLGSRYIPKNLGYALISSTQMADVYVNKLARSGRMISYDIVPLMESETIKFRVIPFMINPAYVLSGSLDGMVGSHPANLTNYSHVPEMRAQYGSRYSASYYQPEKAKQLKASINQGELVSKALYENRFDDSDSQSQIFEELENIKQIIRDAEEVVNSLTSIKSINVNGVGIPILKEALQILSIVTEIPTMILKGIAMLAAAAVTVLKLQMREKNSKEVEKIIEAKVIAIEAAKEEPVKEAIKGAIEATIGAPIVTIIGPTPEVTEQAIEQAIEQAAIDVIEQRTGTIEAAIWAAKEAAKKVAKEEIIKGIIAGTIEATPEEVEKAIEEAIEEAAKKAIEEVEQTEAQTEALKEVQELKKIFEIDQKVHLEAIGDLEEWQKKIDVLRKDAYTRNLVNTYTWDADGGIRIAEQSVANSIRHYFIHDYNEDMNDENGATFDLLVTPIKAGLITDQVQEYYLRTSRIDGKQEALELSVDLSGMESRDITDLNDLPLTPGEKVKRYSFTTFYQEGDVAHLDDFKNQVVDPIWLQSNAESALILRNINQGKPWRVRHLVTDIERPTLLGAGHAEGNLLDKAANEVIDYVAGIEIKQGEMEEQIKAILAIVQKWS